MPSSEFSILPPDALSDLQALNESNMPHIAVLVTIAPTSGTRTGGALDDPTPVVLFENEPCRLSQTRPAPGNDAGQTRTARSYTLTLRRGAVIPPNAIALVRGQDRENAPLWERSIRVLDSMSTRLVSSVAQYAAVDAGPTQPRTN